MKNKILTRIKCFFGFHDLRRMYTRRRFYKSENRYSEAYNVFECRNCLTEIQEKI